MFSWRRRNFFSPIDLKRYASVERLTYRKNFSHFALIPFLYSKVIYFSNFASQVSHLLQGVTFWAVYPPRSKASSNNNMTVILLRFRMNGNVGYFFGGRANVSPTTSSSSSSIIYSCSLSGVSSRDHYSSSWNCSPIHPLWRGPITSRARERERAQRTTDTIFWRNWGMRS